MTFAFKKFFDSDRPKYDSLHLNNRLNTFQYPSIWVVDEERGALMIEFGGRGTLDPEFGEPPNFYALSWQGQVIELEGYHKISYPSKGKRQVYYQMTRMVVPKELEYCMEDIISMLHEAILVSWNGRGIATDAVQLEFTKIYYV